MEPRSRLFDVGSESHWINEIRLANTSGNELPGLGRPLPWRHRRVYERLIPVPGGRIGLPRRSGIASFEFRRMDPTPEYQTVVNGQSPMMMVPGYGFASIALAYLNDTNQIVSDPTNRILVLLEDGGTDRDYDDYVGILADCRLPVPPLYPVSPNCHWHSAT